ncbi:MAG: acetoin utilization protein AcuC [Rhodosalinus sp.]
MTAPLFIGSEVYRGSSYGPHHPLRVPRVPTVIDLARALGWLPRACYRPRPRAKPAALATFHDPAYLEALSRAERTQDVSAETRARHGLGTLSNPVFPEMFRRPATAAGGSLLAAEIAAAGGRVFNPGGGTHHGLRDRAAGFCYLNDPVLALLRLRALGLDRIAYVDIDAHHADGVEAALAGAEGMLLISTHEEGRWPFTGALDDRAGGVALNLPLPRGAHDGDFARALDEVILPAVAAHRPQAIVLQCGADAVAEDPLSRLGWSNRSHAAAVRALAPLAPGFVLLGGGGYNPWSVGRAWTLAWATLAGHEVPDRLPEAAQAVLRGLRWSHRLGREVPEAWLTTLADSPREGAPTPDVAERLRRLRARQKLWV